MEIGTSITRDYQKKTIEMTLRFKFDKDSSISEEEIKQECEKFAKSVWQSRGGITGNNLGIL